MTSQQPAQQGAPTSKAAALTDENSHYLFLQPRQKEVFILKAQNV